MGEVRLSLERVVHGLDGEPLRLWASPCGRWLLVAGFEDHVARLDLADLGKDPVKIGAFEEEGADVLCFLPGDRVVLAGPRAVTVHGLQDGRCVGRLALGATDAVDLGAAIDGHRVMLQGLHRRPLRWELESGETRRFEGPWPVGNRVAVHAGLYLGTTDRTPLLDDPDGAEVPPARMALVGWDVETGEVVLAQQAPGKAKDAAPVDFFCDGRAVVVGWSTGQVTRHRLPDGKRLASLGKSKGHVMQVWPLEGGGVARLDEAALMVEVAEAPRGLPTLLSVGSDLYDPDGDLAFFEPVLGGRGLARLLEGGRWLWVGHLERRAAELALPEPGTCLASAPGPGGPLYVGLEDGSVALVEVC